MKNIFKNLTWKKLMLDWDVRYHFQKFSWELWRQGYKITRIELENQKGSTIVIDNVSQNNI